MSLRDTLLALLAAVTFGLAFIAIKIGLGEAPPLLLTALRFTFAAFPAVLFVRPPRSGFALTTAYGLMIGAGQFGLLFIAIGQGMPIGLASLVIQLQAFITMFLAWLVLKERPTRLQGIASLIALAGMVVIGYARWKGAAIVPFLLVIAAAFFWGAGNLLGKLAGRIDMFAFTIWSSLAAPLPLLALSWLLERERVLTTLAHPTWTLALSVAAIAYGATVVGFGLWSLLLSRNPAAAVAPFALLIPVIGMISGRIVFGESIQPLEWLGAGLVFFGLLINVTGPRLFAMLRR